MDGNRFSFSPANSAQIMIWMILFLILAYIGPEHWKLTHLIAWAFLNTLFYIVVANLNLYLYFPKFLQSNSFILFISALIGTCLIASPLKLWINQFLCQSESSPCAEWITDPKFHFISLLIVGSVSSLIRIPFDWLRVQNEKKTLQTRTIESELQFLKNQINPHFLFNTLNNLYALTLKKSEYAPDMVLKLSDMLRYMLYECNETVVPLSKEIQYIRNYLDLEKLRLSREANIQLNIEGDSEGIKVAPLLFIPFIENSFKHGLRNHQGAAFINIYFGISNELNFQIINSKSMDMPGFGRSKPSGGIGLTNVRKRLELIYPDMHRLNISDEPDQFIINLTLKIK
ncbi:MAG: histidine kinase [Saprospiraceae bacterium]|nr:histidine kinase [Saprospiraceae bacterium]HMW39825.1 histidine kinase [Saprospiraceae bacterium]HMX88799.1 histidine kinase [Saprospiraceae bacterium]HMZ39083.1 histidine kinase [Saprospiraceae bacterium]HNA63423.1 histidine kinase [Saprospiraceae bacterium]